MALQKRFVTAYLHASVLAAWNTIRCNLMCLLAPSFGLSTFDTFLREFIVALSTFLGTCPCRCWDALCSLSYAHLFVLAGRAFFDASGSGIFA